MFTLEFTAAFAVQFCSAIQFCSGIYGKAYAAPSAEICQSVSDISSEICEIVGLRVELA